MKSKVSLFLSFVFLLVTFAGINGCAEVQSNTGNTKTVTDILGREVEIPENPERIVCLYAATAHMIALVGETEKIIGAPGGVRRDVLMRIKFPGISEVSSPMQESIINAEELLKIEPDLVLMRRDIANSPSESEKLNNLGIPYLAVDFHTIDELRSCLNLMGEIFNQQDVVLQYLDYMDEIFSLLENRLDGVDEEEKIRVYHSINDTLRTPAPGSISEEITNKAGIINVAVENAESMGLISTMDATLEQVYMWDPDAIIVNEYFAVDYIMMSSRWGGLTAVINDRVYSLPLGISRWSHHGSIEPHMAALFLAWNFYPDRFSDIDMHKTVVDYYNRFFELDIDFELGQRILTGEGMRVPT